MLNQRIYLDHAATTPVRPEVLEAMLPFFTKEFGNPSSIYAEGQFAKRKMDDARDLAANALGVSSSEIVFTSGGTEADNIALEGAWIANRSRGNHIIVSSIEHEAILKCACRLTEFGAEVTMVDPDSNGTIHGADILSAMRPDTILVSIMHANNEVGTIQPIREISDIAHEHNILIHTDAVQSFAHCQFTAEELGVDLISLSAHKIYGPKGVGLLYIKDGTNISSCIVGGLQERGRRAGTENVAGIVGCGEAVRLLMLDREDDSKQMKSLRDYFLDQLLLSIPSAEVNGDRISRLPNNINISFCGMDAQSILITLDMNGISASSGSACASGSIEPSHVLQAMKLSNERVMSALRFTLGRQTTRQELDITLNTLFKATSRYMN